MFIDYEILIERSEEWQGNPVAERNKATIERGELLFTVSNFIDVIEVYTSCDNLILNFVLFTDYERITFQ